MKRLISSALILFTCLVCQVFAQVSVPNQLEDKAKNMFSGGSKQAAKHSIAADATFSDKAFTDVAESLFPLKPEQIHTIRRLYNQTNQAVSFTEDTPPRPTSSALVVDLSPGATPPVVRLSEGYVSSLIFLDKTGAPWPIKAYDIGDPNTFNVTWNNGQKNMSHLILVQPMKQYKTANMAVILQGLDTPVMITLLSGQRAADYRVDVHVPRLGPKARPMAQSDAGLSTDNDLINVLNHLAPPHSKALSVVGGKVEAWLRGDRLYIRTPLTLVSPGWLGKISSADNHMHAYVLPPTSAILALKNGRTITLTVKGL